MMRLLLLVVTFSCLSMMTNAIRTNSLRTRSPKSFVVSTNYDEDEQVSNAEDSGEHNAHVVSSTDKSGDGYVVVSRTEDQKHTHRIDDSDSLSSSGPEVRSFFSFKFATIFSRERERETMSSRLLLLVLTYS